MAFLGQEEQIREFQDRFKYIYAALFLGLGILLARLVFLQILKGDEMRHFSEENRIKRIKIAAPRGMIFDRNHTLLIDNRPAFDLEIIPQYFHESHQEKQVVRMLSKILTMPEADIFDTLHKAAYQPSYLPVKIKTDLTRDEVAEVEVWKIQMPGVEVTEEIKRTNVYREVGAHLLGYIGEVNSSELPVLNRHGLRYRLGDNIGKFGLEQKMENTLRGVDGEEVKEVDALGRVKLERSNGHVISKNEGRVPVPGKNLILTIDQDLQLAAVKAFGDTIGAMVAIDPRNGQILAMVSRPSFDPTEFSRGIPTAIWNRLLNNENHPLRDKTLQDHYSPGSTFKVITAIAGLEEGVIDEHTTFHCGGVIKIGNRQYHCHSKHGDINVVRALTQSCDIFFYRVAQKLKSVDVIAKYAREFGLGQRTGIPLPREVPGLIPTEEWKLKRYGLPWNPGETATVAIGQSFVLTTVLQMANLYATIANGGTLYRPYIIKEVESADGKALKQFDPQVIHSVNISAKTMALVKKGLWGVVNTPIGTAYHQRLPGMDFVGKTGTVQVIRLSADKIYRNCHEMKFRDRHNAVFVGYAPANNPVIAVAVLGEHACHGGTGAAPIARAVIKTYLQKYFPDVYGDKVLAARLKKEGKSIYVPKTKTSVEDESISVDNDSLVPSEDNTAPAPLSPPHPITPSQDQVAPDDGSEGDEP